MTVMQFNYVYIDNLFIQTRLIFPRIYLIYLIIVTYTWFYIVSIYLEWQTILSMNFPLW